MGLVFHMFGEKAPDNEAHCIGNEKLHPMREYIMKVWNIVDSTLGIELGEVPYVFPSSVSIFANISMDIGWKSKVSYAWERDIYNYLALSIMAV